MLIWWDFSRSSTFPEKYWKQPLVDTFRNRCSFSNFAIFIGKHLCWSPVLIKAERSRIATLLKKRLQHRCFLVNIAKFLRTPFFIEHLRWLLLKYISRNQLIFARYMKVFFYKVVLFFHQHKLTTQNFCWKYYFKWSHFQNGLFLLLWIGLNWEHRRINYVKYNNMNMNR